MQIEKSTGEILKLTPTGRISRAKPKLSKLSLGQQQERIANKANKFFATMRSIINLANKSDEVDEFFVGEIRKELSDILDLGILSYPSTLTQYGIKPEMSYQERKEAFGLKKYITTRTENEKKFLKSMAHKADICNKANWSWRIAQEAEEKNKLNWYPFFITLTVDPLKADPEEIWRDPKYFRNYIRKLCNVVCKELGHNPIQHPPYRKESDYLTYAGVIEHGKSRLHHHCHIVVWLRDIPSAWKQCPNAGIRNPKNRNRNECIPMRELWDYSDGFLSPSLYFRSVNDVWKRRHNFALPLSAKGPNKGKPMKISTPGVAGTYITKYMQKGHKEWNHRMRATRNLGMTRLRKTLEEIDLKVLEALTWRAPKSSLNHSLMQIHSVPLGLLRQEASRKTFVEKYKRRQLDLISLLQSNTGLFITMLKNVQAGLRPDRMRSSEFYDWVSQFSPVPREYCKERQIAAHTALGMIFPPRLGRKEHVNFGGNEINRAI